MHCVVRHIYVTGNFVTPAGDPVPGGVDAHLLHAESKSLKTVCRSTYAAELMAATSCADVAIALGITLHEIECGPLGAEKLRKIRDDGWVGNPTVKIQLFMDARSVFESFNSTIFKPPTEVSLAGHVLWMREMYDKALISQLSWTDTRDMFGDGLTKGSVARDALIAIMSGKLEVRHKVAFIHRMSHVRTSPAINRG